jgi:hypothetical protein
VAFKFIGNRKFSRASLGTVDIASIHVWQYDVHCQYTLTEVEIQERARAHDFKQDRPEVLRQLAPRRDVLAEDWDQ